MTGHNQRNRLHDAIQNLINYLCAAFVRQPDDLEKAKDIANFNERIKSNNDEHLRWAAFNAGTWAGYPEGQPMCAALISRCRSSDCDEQSKMIIGLIEANTKPAFDLLVHLSSLPEWAVGASGCITHVSVTAKKLSKESEFLIAPLLLRAKIQEYIQRPPKRACQLRLLINLLDGMMDTPHLNELTEMAHEVLRPYPD